MPVKQAERESRHLVGAGEMRIESRADGKKVIVGRAVVYNTLSDDLGGFVEMVRPGAFAEALQKADVRCLFNHDPNQVLGRQSSGTLRLVDKPDALYYECDLPNSPLGQSLAESIGRGDVSQNSFTFATVEQRWTFRKHPEPDFRELIKADIFDVGPVTFAAYPSTDVALRSRDLSRPAPPAGTPRIVLARLAIEEAEL